MENRVELLGGPWDGQVVQWGHGYRMIVSEPVHPPAMFRELPAHEPVELRHSEYVLCKDRRHAVHRG